MTAPRTGVGYWKGRARRAEEIVKARSDYDDVAILAAKWREHERVTREVKAAADEARHELLLRLAGAEMRAAVSGRMTAAQAQALVEGMDLERYVREDGVDTGAISTFVSEISSPALAVAR